MYLMSSALAGRFKGQGNPLQYSCLENPCGWSNLVGFSPLGCEVSDMIERLHTAQCHLGSPARFFIALFIQRWICILITWGLGQWEVISSGVFDEKIRGTHVTFPQNDTNYSESQLWEIIPESGSRETIHGRHIQVHKCGLHTLSLKIHPINILQFANFSLYTKVKVLLIQLCPTLCDPIDCSLPVLCPWDSPGKNTGVGCHFLLQGIFLTQGSNPGLLHCRWALYHLSPREALSTESSSSPCLSSL